MKSQSDLTYYYPNRLGRILLQAMEEVLGRNGVIAVLKQARLRKRINNYPKNSLDKNFSFEEVSKIQNALDASYGLRGGRGLALRVGRSCFKYILNEFGPEMVFDDLASRPISQEDKIRTVIKILAELFNIYSDQQMSVDEKVDQYTWTITRCPFCWHLRADDPLCLQLVGLLQEALYWVSNGRFYNIEEVDCIAKGDKACLIVIDKQPLD